MSLQESQLVDPFSLNLFDEMSCVTDVCFDDLIETKAREMIETMEFEKEHVRLEKMKLDEKLEKEALEHKHKLEKTTQKLQSLLKKPNLTLSKHDYDAVRDPMEI